MRPSRTFESAPLFEARIGHELTLIRRHELSAGQVAFLREETIKETRNAIRRGALPLVVGGSRRQRIDGVAFAGQLHQADELLALEFLRGWLEGRFDLPVAAGEGDAPEDLLQCRHLLRRGLEPFEVSNAAVAGLQGLSEGRNRNRTPQNDLLDTKEPRGRATTA